MKERCKRKNEWWVDKPYAFIRVPKNLFSMPQYSALSALAKLLYGFLLDRSSLSSANGEDWVNEKGQVFVYFPIAEIMGRFGCGHDKAAALLQELEQAGLIDRTLKGRGQPYHIVVKSFTMSWADQKSEARNYRNSDFGNIEANKTEGNKTYMNKTDTITITDREGVMKKIKENLYYDALLEQVPKNLLDGIVDVIVDTLCSPTPTVRIAGETVPREEVCRRFRVLDQVDIYYVNDLLKKEPGEIRYLRGYILARLYEAKHLSDTFYTKWADQDINNGLA